MLIQDSTGAQVPASVVKNHLICGLLAIIFFALGTGAAVAAPAWLDKLKDSCRKGNTQDCLNVGVAYTAGELQGNKVDKDPQQARIFIDDGLRMGEQRCSKGNSQDCYTLGVLYFEGGIIPTDIPRGLDYLQKSCRGGYKKACDWLDNSGLK
ncbi:MAG TPA: hypothetical protein VIM41_11955 [Gammaproteobacteria bacterium]